MNFKIPFAFLGIIALEVLISFLLALKYDCIFDFDYVCYNVLGTCKNFMSLLNYILIGSYVIDYIINDINDDEDLKEIICDVIVKKFQKKSEEDSENDSIEETSEEDSSEGSLHESDIIYEDSIKSESEISEEDPKEENETSELKQRNNEDRINEIDIDKSIKDFSDMIQTLVENHSETHPEKAD